MYCSKCGTYNDEGTNFCSKCGSDMRMGECNTDSKCGDESDVITGKILFQKFGQNKIEAIKYVRIKCNLGLKEASDIVNGIYSGKISDSEPIRVGDDASYNNYVNAKKERAEQKQSQNEFYEYIKHLPSADVWGTRKEIKYLHTILLDEEVVNAVSSGIMNNRTWLMASTNKRVLLINCHMIVGLEQMDIPLNKINSINIQKRVFFSAIVIQHGSDTICIDNVLKGSEQYFVDSTNKAIREYNSQGVFYGAASSQSSNADEIRKYKELLDMGAITQEEYDKKKAQLLGL